MKIESNISHLSANTIILISPRMHLCVNIKTQLQIVNDKSDRECLVELVTPLTNLTTLPRFIFDNQNFKRKSKKRT